MGLKLNGRYISLILAVQIGKWTAKSPLCPEPRAMCAAGAALRRAAERTLPAPSHPIAIPSRSIPIPIPIPLLIPIFLPVPVPIPIPSHLIPFPFHPHHISSPFLSHPIAVPIPHLSSSHSHPFGRRFCHSSILCARGPQEEITLLGRFPKSVRVGSTFALFIIVSSFSPPVPTNDRVRFLDPPHSASLYSRQFGDSKR